MQVCPALSVRLVGESPRIFGKDLKAGRLLALRVRQADFSDTHGAEANSTV